MLKYGLQSMNIPISQLQVLKQLEEKEYPDVLAHFGASMPRQMFQGKR